VPHTRSAEKSVRGFFFPGRTFGKGAFSGPPIRKIGIADNASLTSVVREKRKKSTRQVGGFREKKHGEKRLARGREKEIV